MRDQIFDRDYAAGRDALNDGIDRLIASTAEVFKSIARAQFAAPWKGPRRAHR